MRYAKKLIRWLYESGYRTCFYVGGGNIMHLVDAAHECMTCIPCVHEVSCGIACEYFNESGGRAFALVTAGPGLTNIITAIAGAYLENREILVLGGQVKSSDLLTFNRRQHGIQEICGSKIVQPIAKASITLTQAISKKQFKTLITQKGRKGPVFIEICLDVQGKTVDDGDYEDEPILSLKGYDPKALDYVVDQVKTIFEESNRPIILLGGGVLRKSIWQDHLEKLQIPTMTTWNGMDRIDSSSPIYLGRPNTWGMRYSNIILQQADFLLAVGARLGLQQIGFNWKEFCPFAKIVQIDIDEDELSKPFPHIDLGIAADANQFLEKFLNHLRPYPLKNWLNHCQKVKTLLPTVESDQESPYLNAYSFIDRLSNLCTSNDIIIPCSSGGAFSITMQVFKQKLGQIIISNKGLASMGYGLAGAIGSACFHKRRTILIEGDGGFAQNLQELGTVSFHNLPLKIFLFDNLGYASIRATQQNYFQNRYYGCDIKTGLGLPHFEKIFEAYDISFMDLALNFDVDQEFLRRFISPNPCAFRVPLDPNQIYFPKISSRINKDGSLESNPLHLMTPPLSRDLMDQVILPEGKSQLCQD